MLQKNKNYTVITGASSGIGYETAKAFAARKKNLIIIARNQNNLEQLKEEIKKVYPLVDIVIKASDLTLIQNVYQLYNELNEYSLETWINNAGFGYYGNVSKQSLAKIEDMIHLNVLALTILSSLFVRDYKDIEGTQLINISSGGGYTIVPTAVTYCATKFYVSAFTEGLARELKNNHAKMQVKVFAPAATKTSFGKIANNVEEYDYDKSFGLYHTSQQAANLILNLYDSNKPVAVVDRETFTFQLSDPLFAYAGNSSHNQKTIK